MMMVYCNRMTVSSHLRLQARERHPTIRPPGHGQDADGAADRQHAERARAQDRQRPADTRQVRGRERGEYTTAVRRGRGGGEEGEF